MNTNLYNIVSRTCEAAGLRKTHISVKRCEEFMYPHDVPSFQVERHKTLSMTTDMCFYPHRDSMLQDLFFSLAYQMIMNETGEELYLYPQFADKINNLQTKDLDTATAKVFRQYYESIEALGKRYDNLGDEDYGEHFIALPAKYSGHTPKKSGVNMLADHLNIQVFVFRAGWMVKNVHSAFDYIFNSTKKDTTCAKVLAHWLVKVDDQYVGGIPPSGDDISHKKKELRTFCRSSYRS